MSIMRIFDRNSVQRIRLMVNDLSEAEATLSERYTKLDEAITTFNAILEGAREMRDEIVADIEASIEGRSDKWREGEQHEIWQTLLADWRELDLDAIEPVDEPELDHSDRLSDMPTDLDQ